jgi:hypothetical protein
MQVVPNPTKNMVTVTMISQVKQDFTVEVLDINGRKIFKHVIVKESNNSPVKINTSTFNNGIYYIKATGKDFTNTQKLIVLH